MTQWLEDNYPALQAAEPTCVDDTFLIVDNSDLGCAGDNRCLRFEAVCTDWAQDLTQHAYLDMSDDQTCQDIWAAMSADFTATCAGVCACNYDS